MLTWSTFMLTIGTFVDPLVEFTLASTVSFAKARNFRYCSNEDDIFVPELIKRFVYPKNLETDHEILADQLKEIEKKIELLKVGGTIDDLLETWIAYETMMLPHLQQEEEIGLPLMRAYFTKEDMAPIIQKLVAHSPAFETGSLIYFDTPQRFRSDFMKNEGIPSFVWYIDFRSKHKLFTKAFVDNLEAVKLGQEPKACFFATVRASISRLFSSGN